MSSTLKKVIIIEDDVDWYTWYSQIFTEFNPPLRKEYEYHVIQFIKKSADDNRTVDQIKGNLRDWIKEQCAQTSENDIVLIIIDEELHDDSNGGTKIYENFVKPLTTDYNIKVLFITDYKSGVEGKLNKMENASTEVIAKNTITSNKILDGGELIKVLNNKFAFNLKTEGNRTSGGGTEEVTAQSAESHWTDLYNENVIVDNLI